ncbi:hypothetical protein [Altererythrobacter aquiaggeris]|uniref:hypothetical protein n=1 Tax=Aestuarierythrobacter aquiaggeris TaxID=1898396 RepID=UPI00301ACE60
MTISGWYKALLALWALAFVPFHAFVMLFNDKSLLSLPDAPGPSGSPLGLYLGYMTVMFSPLFLIPFALRKSK